MSELDSMWWCPTCETWVGTKIETCFVCNTERPLLPVTHDQVPVKDSKHVTLKHRLSAKLRRVVP